jgi:integrase
VGFPKFDVVKAWLDNVAYSHSRSESTRYKYRRHFGMFCDFAETSPEAILEEYDRSDERSFRRKYAMLVKAWISSFSGSGLTNGSVVDRVSAVKSFFRYNDLPIGFLPRAKIQVTYHNRDIEKEEILAIIEQSRPRERAFFAFMVQSGLRPDTIRQLQFRDLESLDRVPCKVNVPRTKTKGEYGEYFTFIGEDATRYLKGYLATRKNLKPTDYVFTDDLGTKPVWKTLPSVAFQRTARRLRDSGKLQYATEKQSVKTLSELRLYNLRKYFRKMAYQAGSDFVNFWMGHKPEQRADEHYFSKDAEYHRKVYAEKAMPYLRLASGLPTETERIIRNQAQEIQQLRELVQNLTEAHETLERKIRERSLDEFILTEVKNYIDEKLKDPEWQRRALEPFMKKPVEKPTS